MFLSVLRHSKAVQTKCKQLPTPIAYKNKLMCDEIAYALGITFVKTPIIGYYEVDMDNRCMYGMTPVNPWEMCLFLLYTSLFMESDMRISKSIDFARTAMVYYQMTYRSTVKRVIEFYLNVYKKEMVA